MFLYIFDFEEHKSQPMSTHQSPFFIVFFPHHSMKLAKNSSLAELASSFAELETWAQDIPLGILAQKTLIVYSEMIKLMWIEKGLRMP